MSNINNNKEIMFYPSKFKFWLWNFISLIIFVYGLEIFYLVITTTLKGHFDIKMLIAIPFAYLFLYQAIIYINTPFVYYNESKSCFKIRNRVIPLKDIKGYRGGKFKFEKIFNGTVYRVNFELVLNNGDTVPFYGFFNECKSDVRKTFEKYEIYKLAK